MGAYWGSFTGHKIMLRTMWEFDLNGFTWSIYGQGGSYTAPPGGTDQHSVMFRMSGEETAYFVPKGQATQGGGSGRANIKIVNQHDTRGELLDSVDDGSADQVLHNWMRRNRNALRSLLR